MIRKRKKEKILKIMVAQTEKIFSFYFFLTVYFYDFVFV